MGKPSPNRLRVLRAERRMTQRTLALKCRINIATVSLIENGHIEPTSDHRARFARVLKVPLEAIFPPLEEEAAAS